MSSISSSSTSQTASSTQHSPAPRCETDYERHYKTFREKNAHERAAAQSATDRASSESDSRSPPRSLTTPPVNPIITDDDVSSLYNIINPFRSFLHETTSLRRWQMERAMESTRRIESDIDILSQEVPDISLNRKLVRRIKDHNSSVGITLVTMIPQNETHDRRLRNLFASAVSAADDIELRFPADTGVNSTAESGFPETLDDRASSEGDTAMLSHPASKPNLGDTNTIDENVVPQAEEQIIGSISDSLTNDVLGVSSPMRPIFEPPTLEGTNREPATQNLQTQVAHLTELCTRHFGWVANASNDTRVESVGDVLKSAFVSICFVAVVKKVLDGGHNV